MMWLVLWKRACECEYPAAKGFVPGTNLGITLAEVCLAHDLRVYKR